MQKATCPLALSFIFKAYLPLGSTGIGCTIDKSVKTYALKSEKNSISFNGEKIILPTVITAMKILTDIPTKLIIESPLPLACGFGVSGAATLASLFAVNKLLKLNKSDENLAAIAHFAEIKNRTGLGTVATQTTGGFLIKKRAGVPSEFDRLDFAGKKIYATIIDSLKTPTILSDATKLKKINLAADRALRIVKNKKDISLEDILNISYEYCLKSGLLTNNKTKNIIELIRNSGGCATMAILGQTVLSNIRPGGKNEYHTFDLTITDNTVKVF